MTTRTSHPMRLMPRTRWAISLAVLACVSLALHAAFAGKAEFQRSKPHVNVKPVGPIELEPIADAALTGEEASDRETPCPCLDGGEGPVDEGSPVKVLKLLDPPLSPEALWDGVDIALVEADLPGLERGDYLIRVYAFEDLVYSSLVDRRGKEIPLETHDFSIGDPGVVEACGAGSSCGDITPHPDGTLSRTCCVAIACSNGFLWTGCFTATVP